MRIEYNEIDNGWVVETDDQRLIAERRFMFFKSKNKALAWIITRLKKEKLS